MKPRLAGALALAGGLALIAGLLTVKTQRDQWFWDHWDVVKPGILYRSGQLHPDQLEEAIRLYGIRTVINLQVTNPESEAERDLVRSLGVDFLNLPMPGDGFGREEQFRKALAVIDDPNRQPVLVHCARGTCRTGATVALYRYERDGWCIEDVDAEMRRQTYYHGWLPGYIHAMVDKGPFYELHPAGMIEDRNNRVAGEGRRDVH